MRKRQTVEGDRGRRQQTGATQRKAPHQWGVSQRVPKRRHQRATKLDSVCSVTGWGRQTQVPVAGYGGRLHDHTTALPPTNAGARSSYATLIARY